MAPRLRTRWAVAAAMVALGGGGRSWVGMTRASATSGPAPAVCTSGLGFPIADFAAAGVSGALSATMFWLADSSGRGVTDDKPHRLIENLEDAGLVLIVPTGIFLASGVTGLVWRRTCSAAEVNRAEVGAKARDAAYVDSMRGKAGQPCRAWTCDPGLRCDGGEFCSRIVEGQEGGACLPTGACAQGLECEQGFCRPARDDAPGPTAP